MKKPTVLALIAVLCIGLAPETFASDWDTAGKVLTGIEGLRIISGGNIDLIGSITGINGNRSRSGFRHSGGDFRYSESDFRHGNNGRYHKHHSTCPRKWVKNQVWKKKWVPTHTEYNKKYGEIVVEGHYIKYKVTRNGYWQYSCRYN